MKKQFLIISLLCVGKSFSVDAQKAIDDHLQNTKKLVLDAGVKKMSKVAKQLNNNTRDAIKEELGDDTYKEYRKVYVKEETARWHDGTNKVKDKTLSKDERALANSLLKTKNKLKIVPREKYGDVSKIIKKLDTATQKTIQKHS